MQRIYGKTNMKEKEFYELREPQPLTTERHPDAYKMGNNAIVSPPQAEQRQFTIPSSSHMIEKDTSSPPPSHPIKSYFPARQAYFHEPSSSHNTSTFSPQHEVYSSPRNLHCVVIADHIVECPICSRFYRNYSPLYNGIIIVLVIILLVILFRSRPAHHHQPSIVAAPAQMLVAPSTFRTAN